MLPSFINAAASASGTALASNITATMEQIERIIGCVLIR